MQSDEPLPPDFKYTPSLSLGQSLKRDRSPERPQSSVNFISDPHNYTRKRASIACEICRVRKTRCDGAKPSCVSCVKLGVACSYAKPTSGNRPGQDAAGLFLSKIDARLDRIDSRLDQIESMLDNKNSRRLYLQNPATSPKAPSTYTTASTPNPRTTGSTSGTRAGPASSSTSKFPQEPGAPPPLLGYTKIGLSEEFLVRLAGHDVSQVLSPLRFNEAEAYLERENAQGSHLFRAADPSWTSLDLSPQVRFRFQQSFASTILAWFPLFDPDTFSKWVAETYNDNFGSQNQHTHETSRALFILALGALAQDDCLTTDDPRQFSGLAYFLVACRILNQNPVPSYSIVEIQCQILMGLYLMLCLRPLQACHAIAQASRSILTLLNCRSRLANNDQLRESCHRAYWICFVAEDGLYSHIVYASQVMSPKVREAVPLPIGHYNEPDMHWFLAEISLRRLHSSIFRSLWKQSDIVHDPGIMYKSGIDYEPCIVYKPGIVYEPILIKEQQQSLRKWYESLHPHVKFPEDSLPLLEPQKAYLRVRYFALHWIVYWPAVVRLVTKAPDDEKQHADLLKFSTEAIRYLIQHVFSTEALVKQRYQMLFHNLIGAHYTTMILLCIYCAPAFSHIPKHRIIAAIRKGHEYLCFWAANPGVANSLRHVELEMVHCGLLSSVSAPTSASASASASASTYRAPGGADGGAPSLGPVATAVLAQARMARLRVGPEVAMEGGGGV